MRAKYFSNLRRLFVNYAHFAIYPDAPMTSLWNQQFMNGNNLMQADAFGTQRAIPAGLSAGKYLTTSSLFKNSNCGVSKFPRYNIPTMANFKLLTLCHLTQIWREMPMVHTHEQVRGSSGILCVYWMDLLILQALVDALSEPSQVPFLILSLSASSSAIYPVPSSAYLGLLLLRERLEVMWRYSMKFLPLHIQCPHVHPPSWSHIHPQETMSVDAMSHICIHPHGLFSKKSLFFL